MLIDFDLNNNGNCVNNRDNCHGDKAHMKPIDKHISSHNILKDDVFYGK